MAIAHTRFAPREATSDCFDAIGLRTCGEQCAFVGLKNYFWIANLELDGLADSRLRDVQKLNHLYLVAAVAILYSTIMGTTVQLSGLRQQVDTHYSRGLSYLKIGLIDGYEAQFTIARKLLQLLPLPKRDPERCES